MLRFYPVLRPILLVQFKKTMFKQMFARHRPISLKHYKLKKKRGVVSNSITNKQQVFNRRWERSPSSSIGGARVDMWNVCLDKCSLTYLLLCGFFVFLLKSHKAFVLYLAIYFIGIISNIRDTSFAYFFRRGCGGCKSLPLRGTPIFSSTPHPLRLH